MTDNPAATLCAPATTAALHSPAVPSSRHRHGLPRHRADMPKLNAREVERDDRALDALGRGEHGDDELTRWLAVLRDVTREYHGEPPAPIVSRPRHATRFHRRTAAIRVLLFLALLGFVTGVTVAFTSQSSAAAILALTALPLIAAGCVARVMR